MTRTELRADARRWRRGDLWTVLFAVALGSAVAWVVLSLQGLNRELDQADADRDALAAQVERLGGDPVAGDPGKAGERGEPGEAGADGAAGSKGDKGEPGEKGEPGSDGKRGAAGTDGQPGEPGLPGEDGTPGAAGADGADGATGPTGAQGPQGEKGEKGDPGAQGEQGQRGEQGPPPASWTWVFGGVTYTCTPSAPGSTHYTCAADGPPPDDNPGNGQGPLAAALDPHRRQYT